jgi:hypothetical protein
MLTAVLHGVRRMMARSARMRSDEKDFESRKSKMMNMYEEHTEVDEVKVEQDHSLTSRFFSSLLVVFQE